MPKRKIAIDDFTPDLIRKKPYKLFSLQKADLQSICEKNKWDFSPKDTIQDLGKIIFENAKLETRDNVESLAPLQKLDHLAELSFDLENARQSFEKEFPGKDSFIRYGIITPDYAQHVLPDKSKSICLAELQRVADEFTRRKAQVKDSSIILQKCQQLKILSIEEIQQLRPDKFDFDEWYIVDWLTKCGTLSEVKPNPLRSVHVEVWWDIVLWGHLIDACFLDSYKTLRLHRSEKRPKASRERQGIEGAIELENGPEIGVIESWLPGDKDHIAEGQLQIAMRLKDFMDAAVKNYGIEALNLPFFGIQTAGTQIEVFQLLRPFTSAYVFVSLCKYELSTNLMKDLQLLLDTATIMLTLKRWMLGAWQPFKRSRLSSDAPRVIETAKIFDKKKPHEEKQDLHKCEVTSQEHHDNSVILHAITKEGDPIIIKEVQEQTGVMEVKSLRLISSYYVVELLGAWKSGGMHYIALPKLQPIDWNDPTDEETLQIMFQLLLALRDIHAVGLVHLDISLNNVMRNPETKMINVIDFGLAMPISWSKPYRVVGTAAFMSPEMANGEAVGTATDVFSAGIIFALLMSRSPGWRHLRVLSDYSWGVYRMKESYLIDIQHRLSLICQSATNLLQSMLNPNPKDRITVEAALQHPYFRESAL